MFFWIIVGCGASAMILSVGNPLSEMLSTVFWLAVSWTPLALNLRAKARAARGKRALLEAAGADRGKVFSHAHGGFGIALNPEARTVWLMEGQRLRSFGYADIRKWQDELTGAGIGRLVVHVRDMERAQWRIQMRDPDERARWMELLQREINERGVSA